MPNVLTEVVNKLQNPTGETLVNGDILFRWVPRGIGQRGLVQSLISLAQAKQMDTQHLRHRDESAVQVSAMVVQHVGIFTDRGVREVGNGGLMYNTIKTRKHYDLVVRSRSFGAQIARFANMAIPDLRQCFYPVWDLDKIARNPTVGYDARPEAALHKAELVIHRQAARSKGRVYTNPALMKQAVVCSHFVHAVLYAASVPGATLRTATDHKWDHIFKISPSHMWTEFIHKKGLWANLDAFYVGMQHKGILSRNIDSRLLGVGLKLPPIPSRSTRPSSATLNL